MEHLKYPIGQYKSYESISQKMIIDFIKDIEAFPEKLYGAVKNLSENQLDTPYRFKGWTIRQVVHHCADSHMNSFIRFKLALTEEKPIIKPYFEERWAELIDSKKMPIAPSLDLLKGLHTRWTVLLNSFSSKELKRTFIHPEHGKEFLLDDYIAFYAWHCEHHLAHIVNLKKEKNWE